MPMTKKDLRKLHQIRDALAEGVQYLRSDRIAVAIKGGPATTTLHYTRADGSALYEIEKEIGCKLCYIYTALESLNLLLEHERSR